MQHDWPAADKNCSQTLRPGRHGHHRQWITLSETSRIEGTSTADDISPLHVAVNKSMTGSNVLDRFDKADPFACALWSVHTLVPVLFNEY